jgi:hypothetical protein
MNCLYSDSLQIATLRYVCLAKIMVNRKRMVKVDRVWQLAGMLSIVKEVLPYKDTPTFR